MNDNISVVLAHPDKQHSFKTAKALIDAGALKYYITTVYDKPKSLTHLFTKLTKGSFRKKLQAHRTNEIPDSQVKQYTELLSLFLFVLVRIDKSKKLYSKVKIFRDKVFNKKVARFCKKNKIDAVVSYDVVSAQLYKYLDGSEIIKILDMSAPYFSYMCSIFEKEAEKFPSSDLCKTLKAPLFEYWKKQSEEEIKAADVFLVASDFTKNSLILHGVSEEKIFKCVYGINHDFFNAQHRLAKTSDTLRCVYVGNVTEQKGCRYLFEAIKKIKAEGLDADFTIVGAYNPADPLVAEVTGYCNFTGHILPDKLKTILLNSDVIIFPSLADGFGLSVTEAMACGVLPVVSKNAGVSDIIEDGKNGYLIDAMSSNSIYKILKELTSRLDISEPMRSLCIKTAETILWKNYNEDIKNMVDTVL